MSYGSGSLTIAARRAGARTVIERVRYEGISRCSRAFARGEAALVVFSQLGPGVVRGDSITSCGRLAARAHLIVTYQSATRLLGGRRTARAQANWSLEAGAVLELIGEPLVASADAKYQASTTIELAAGACALVCEIACVDWGAEVRPRISVRQAGREIFFDAADPGAAAPDAVGTFAVIGLDVNAIAGLATAFDRVADDCSDVRMGVGVLPSGVFARVLGADVWAVRTTLAALRAAVYAERVLDRALAKQAPTSPAPAAGR